MKVCIYNEYLNTAGGGEKHMGNIVTYLLQSSNEVTIDLLTHDKIDLAWLSDRLNIDFTKCGVRYLLTDSKYEIEEISEEYHLFINSTVYSNIVPRAKLNAALVFFPIKKSYHRLRNSSLVHKVVKGVLAFLCSSTPLIESSLYKNEVIDGVAGNWTKGRLRVNTKHISNLNNRDLIIQTLAIGEQSLKDSVRSIIADGQRLSYSIVKNEIVIEMNKIEPSIVDIKINTFIPQGKDNRELGIFLTDVHFRVKDRDSKKFISSEKAKSLISTFNDFDYLESYDILWSNSHYTKGWLKKLWRLNSVVLTPVIETWNRDVLTDSKEKVIISVGRFFSGDHNKKHDVMIRAFKSMCDSGLDGWKYVICGGTHPETIHQEYVRKLRTMSEGYPISILTDIPFDELMTKYNKASIFWHAAGYGENESKNPDKFEHFGITTVEAMRAGCIPIVINKAGQKEIVEDGINGCLWSSIEELKSYTNRFIEMDETILSNYRAAAILRSREFGRSNFVRIIDKSLMEFNSIE